MNFLYSNNGNGLWSSLTGSWIFWIIVVMIVVVIVLMFMSTNKQVEEKLRIFRGREDAHLSDAHVINDVRQKLIDEINDENSHMIEMNNGVIPDLQKYIDVPELGEDSVANALPLGVSADKNVKSFYHTSSKKENIFRVQVDNNIDNTFNFKLELRDLTKLSMQPGAISELKIYNQNRKCIAYFDLKPTEIKIKSISPFIDDVILPLDEATRLVVFTQQSNKLFVDTKQVAAFDLYDKITYFVIKSPIIKELQYAGQI